MRESKFWLSEGDETQMLTLGAALIAGEDSGEPERFDFEMFIATKKS